MDENRYNIIDVKKINRNLQIQEVSGKINEKFSGAARMEGQLQGFMMPYEP